MGVFVLPVYLPRSAMYSYGITTVRVFGDNFIKLTTTNVSRTPGIEINVDDGFDYYYDVVPFFEDGGRPVKIYLPSVFQRKMAAQDKRHDTNYVKSLSSICRTKRTVFDYAFSNKFDYFATFTIDPKLHDNFDIDTYHKKFSQFVRNYYRNDFDDLQYLCVPERHKSGSWHEHALIRGLSSNHLRLFTDNERLPHYILSKIKSGYAVYDFPAYRQRFGFCTLEPVRNTFACSSYISKYITKSINGTVLGDYHAKSYFVSRGLQKSVLVKRGYMCTLYCADYHDDRYRTSMFAYSDDFLQTVLSKFSD